MSIKELRIEVPEEKAPAWEKQVEFYHDLVYGGIELPTSMDEYLTAEFQHLAVIELPESATAAAWDAFKSWVGDFTEDERSPRERLSAYFAEQESRIG